MRDALGHLGRVLAIEMNAATDNPLIFPDGGVADADARATGDGHVISGGNFHGEPVALALDFAKLALAELGSISERRIALLLDANLNGGLPAFLGSDSGLETRLHAPPVHGRRPRLGEQGAGPSGVGRLDPDERQPGGPRLDGPDRGPAWRGRSLHHVEQIVAIELLCAARALDLRLGAAARAPRPGAGVAAAHAAVREVVRPWDGDREPGADLEAVARLVREGRLADLAVAA